MKYKALCFSGGAIRGFLHLGALHELKIQDKLDVKEVSGNSIGSLFASIVAMGIDINEIMTLVFDLDINVSDKLDFINFFNTKGLYSSQQMRNICEQIVSLKYNYNITFKELYKDTGIKLNIVATNIDTYTETIFNHIKFPEISILDAIIASMSIPLIFPPVEIDGKRYVDGFLVNDLPYQILEDKENMLILYIDRKCCEKEKENLYEYIFKLLNCVCSSIPKTESIVILDTSCVDNELLSLDLDGKVNLFHHGKKIVKNFLEK